MFDWILNTPLMFAKSELELLRLVSKCTSEALFFFRAEIMS